MFETVCSDYLQQLIMLNKSYVNNDFSSNRDKSLLQKTSKLNYAKSEAIFFFIYGIVYFLAFVELTVSHYLKLN